MGPEFFGALSGALVILSAGPYLWHVYRRNIKPNIVSWALWSVIGFVLLLTYWSSGAHANIWPAVFSFTNPVLCTIMAIYRRGKIERPTRTEFFCLGLGLLALILWVALRNSVEFVQVALYIAILADLCAAVPTMIQVCKDPSTDRPMMWLLFGIGYALAIPAITTLTFANYVLPVYMTLSSTTIAAMLVWPRFQKKVPLKEWF